MKRCFTLTILAALSLVGCSKSMDSEMDSEMDARFTVNTDILTKAAVDGDGAGAQVNRFVMEIYRNVSGQASLYTRIEHEATLSAQGVKSTVFDVKLVKNQAYDVLFWADAAKKNTDGSFTDIHYDTSTGLKAVSLNGDYSGNLDSRDAFFKAVALTAADTQQSFTKTDIKLTRPFAQLNIITTDIDDLEALGGVAVVPQKVTLKFQAPSKFNVKDGTVSSLKDFKSEVTPYYQGHKTLADAQKKYTLSMDYIFAASSQTADVRNISLKVEDSAVLLDTTFENIPLKRNWRTNITGDLLTTTGKFEVVVDPLWFSPDIDM